ncbi:hypothetical protein [Nocardioides albus]|uniref:Uncharacterized protein n=1 Tax=Nocardioides albus TaxID=1841 RepID=A0A7W5F9L9_9ACTN|nr:hypothetical protein [Nocardioides albus]MBB3090370.1 hypothetical protein [Nocardioides albus]GGU43187.1 hypothetical protein GCM10007979_47890 [Nocardioides albus]
MTPTQRVITFGSYWILGLVAFALLLAPYDLTWAPHTDIPVDVFAGRPDFAGGRLPVAALYTVVPFMISVIGGALTGTALARLTGAAPTLSRHLVAQVAGLCLSILVGSATLMMSTLSFAAVPTPTSLTDATYAVLVWTGYVFIGFAIARAVPVTEPAPLRRSVQPRRP